MPSPPPSDLVDLSKLVAPLIGAALGAFVTYVVSTRATLSLALRTRHMEKIFEIDKQLISDPELYAIYPEHEIWKERADLSSPAKIWKRNAFIMFHVNLCEMVYSNRRSLDTDVRESWECWILDFFRQCPEALRVLDTSRKHYPRRFVEFVQKSVGKQYWDARLSARMLVRPQAMTPSHAPNDASSGTSA